MEAGQSVTFDQINAVTQPVAMMLYRLVDIKRDILDFIRAMYEEGPVAFAAPHDVTEIVTLLQQLMIAIQSSAADAYALFN
jgi:hypothetical protein